MSPKNSQRRETSCAAVAHVSRARVLRLCLPLCLLLAAPNAARRAAAQTAQPSSQQSAPRVRPRTVGTKDKKESARPAAQAEGPAAQAERPAAQPDKEGVGAANKTGAQDASKQDANRTAAQDSEAVGDDEVVRVNSNLVIIPATVVDGRGHAVTDLKVDDFELRVDGEVKQIGDLSRADTPVQIALLFDNSASLSAAREFEKQAAVRFFQSVVRPIDRAAIYSISTTASLSQPLTGDVARLVRTVQSFGKPDGATALFDAVAQAADYMRPYQGRKVLVIVSDGTDTVSDTSFEDSVNKALRAECQVYVVQTQQVEDPNLHDTVSEQRMSKLTEQTGGAVYVPQSVEDLDSVFTQISLDISQQYLLGYYPQDDRHDNFFRFISVRVKTRPALRVRARKGFYPASARNDSSLPPEAAKSMPSTFTSSRPDYPASNAAVRTPAGAVASRRSNGGGSLAARDNNAGHNKIGPDGPDDDDRPRQSARAADAADDTAPTFTLTAVLSSSAAPPPSPAASAPEPSAASGSSNLFSAKNSPSFPAANSSSASPSPTPAAPKAVAEATPQPSPAEARTSPAASGQKGETRPGTPISGGVLNSKALSLPRPSYPASAKSAGASGKVVVEVTIDEDGKVIAAHAISGHPMLQQAAVQAARLARFSPAMLSGQPIRVTGTISYTFVWQ